jgi:hypothetical protein
MLYYAAIP